MTHKYNTLIGTGGIGTGLFFQLNGDHTLGREESRMGRFIDRKDYCKLHIIAHYVKQIADIAVLPIGRVGNDEPGNRLMNEMQTAGLDTRYVAMNTDEQTLNCICFIYPDESGGNLTVDDSASSRVDSADIDQAKEALQEAGSSGMVLAVPEVPMAARKRLLELATEYKLFRTASFVTDELTEAKENGMLAMVDLLAINQDEASALTDLPSGSEPKAIAEEAIKTLTAIKPDMLISITAGGSGSFAWDGTQLYFQPIHSVELASTAGAGDAHFSGIISGLAAGLTPAEAQQLGTLSAAMSVTSPHTINHDINKQSLLAFAKQNNIGLPENIISILT